MVNDFNSRSYKQKQSLNKYYEQLRNSKEFEGNINNTPIDDQLKGCSKYTWNLENRLYAFDKILSKENLSLDKKKYIFEELGKSVKRKNDPQLNSQYKKLVNKYTENKLSKRIWGNPYFKKAACYALGLSTLVTTTFLPAGCDYTDLKKSTKLVTNQVISADHFKDINQEIPRNNKGILQAREVYTIQKIDDSYIKIIGTTEEAIKRIKESLKNKGYGILNDVAKDNNITLTGYSSIIEEDKTNEDFSKPLTQIIEQNLKKFCKDIKTYYQNNRDYYPGGNPEKTISTKASFKTVLGNIKGSIDNLFYNGSDIRSKKINEVHRNASISGADILGITTQPNYDGIKQNLFGYGKSKKTVKGLAKSGLNKISKGVIKTWIKNLNPLNKDEFILLHPIKTTADALTTVPNLIVGATEIVTSPLQAIPKTDINGILGNIYDIPKHPIKNIVGSLPSTTTNLAKTILKVPASLGKNGLNKETIYHKLINELFAPIQALETMLAINNPETNIVENSFLRVKGSNISNLIKNITSITRKESYLYEALGNINDTVVSVLANSFISNRMEDKDNGSPFLILSKKKHEKRREITSSKKEEQKPQSKGDNQNHKDHKNEGGNGNDDNPPEEQPQPPEQYDNNTENEPVENNDPDDDYDYKPDYYNW